MTVAPTPKPTLSAEGKKKLDALLKEKVAGKTIPAMYFGATNADDELYFNAGGDKILGEPDKGQVNEDTTVQLFSQTKFVTSLACLQLWEKGLVDYDDEELLKKYIPELLEQKVLQGYDDNGQPRFVERTKPLTLRRLLTHTSGLSYFFLSPDVIARWQQENKRTSFLSKNATIEDAIVEPLIFQPGTKFGYGIGIDWAGVLVMRITGKTLEEYFQENIFGPLGIKHISFYPTPEIKANLMGMCGRDDSPERKLIQTPGHRNVPALEPEDIGFHTGGAGLIGSPRDYLTLLRGVLRCKDQEGGIIKPSSFPKIFESALPPRSEQGKTHTCYTDLGAILGIVGENEPHLLSGEKVTHSLALCVTEADSKNGRKAGSASWGGIAQTKFWIDPTTGVAAVCGTQLTDLDRTHATAIWQEYERALYDSLEQ